MDINEQIYADRIGVLRKGHKSDSLLLIVNYDTFDQMRYQAGNQMFQPNASRDAPHEATFCGAPVIVTNNVKDWCWLVFL